MQEELTCPICGRTKLQNLTSHITRGHKVSKEDFLKLYPDTKMCTDKVSQQCSNAWHIGYGTHLDDHDWISEFTKRAAQTRKITCPDIGKRIAATRHKNNSYSTQFKRLWQNPEYRAMKINQVKQQHADGSLTAAIMAKSGSRRYKVALGDIEYSLRSTWEVQVAEYLFNNNITFESESLCFNYIWNNASHRYFPDFYLPEFNLVLEVKPQSLVSDERVQLKREACINAGYNFMFITENELDKLDTINFRCT